MKLEHLDASSSKIACTNHESLLSSRYTDVLDFDLQLSYGMRELATDDTFTNDLPPLNPGSEYPLYSDFDDYGSPDSSFTVEFPAYSPLPSPGANWSPSVLAATLLDTPQHDSGPFLSYSVLPYREAESPNNMKFKQIPMASPSMASSEFDIDERKLSAVESAIRRMAWQWEGQMSALEVSLRVMALLRATGLDRRMQMRYRNIGWGPRAMIQRQS
ncbi:hypothetical protein CPB84DRAFT_1784575 [Gymnopilus junonius]|uniref:Uncharacterized protein n=1 Tax=Gymnopilus junonius TaxID=109634 RepID=A0A9P5NLE9_GYMJU|nr:hypothetical protein CPB84DRAFT_1784575 [Gymnopilus junonius]